MANFNFKPLQHNQLFSFTFCKYPSALNLFKFHCSYDNLIFSPSNRLLERRFSPKLEISVHVTHLERKFPTQELSRKSTIPGPSDEIGSMSSSSRPMNKKVDKSNSRKDFDSVVGEKIGKGVERDKQASNRLRFKRRGMGSEFSSTRSHDKNLAKNVSKNGDRNQLGVEKMEKGSKKNKADSPGCMLRVGLDMCSKRGDVISAIRLYDMGRKEGIKMGQYHYSVLLYLCSSAATGIVQPAKSGSGGSRSLNMGEPAHDVSFVGSKEAGVLGVQASIPENSSEKELNVTRLSVENSKKSLSGTMGMWPQTLDEMIHLIKGVNDSSSKNDMTVERKESGNHLSEDVKKYSLQRGFEIYEQMHLENVPTNEATLTSVARMAMSMGKGDMAFDIVKKMKELGISPKLRSYGPALSVFCSIGDIEKAFSVEEHMLENNVNPEEPELEALLGLSIDAGRGDKVYYLFHKLRASVRYVSSSTAELIEQWFKSKVASKLGKRKWDEKLIAKAIENGGGGWHGQGWLGRGKWSVVRTSIGDDGVCKCCGEKLATIDLDPVVTEKFAESVASLATQREKHSSFQQFQKWIDYYGPFEAVVDGANVGLLSQRRFQPSKINTVVNGIRQKLPSKKWPLIVLHNRRIYGDKMDEPVNKVLIEKWKKADALYATPTGSNDDWYWLYAAIKFKCLLVTNDEMRDHLFQLLGNDFFPRWKERHQVRFRFLETGPVFLMPPPCSFVIQESEKGHWHIPVVSEGERTWLCITRGANSAMKRQDSAAIQGDHQNRENGSKYLRREARATPSKNGNKQNTKPPARESFQNLRNILSLSINVINHESILPEIEAAEKLGSCTVDFQI